MCQIDRSAHRILYGILILCSFLIIMTGDLIISDFVFGFFLCIQLNLTNSLPIIECSGPF